MKGDLIYHEMSGPQKELHHIYDCLEYSHSVISEGIAGQINCEHTVREVIDIQSDVCDELHKAMEGIVKLIGAHTELKEDSK